MDNYTILFITLGMSVLTYVFTFSLMAVGVVLTLVAIALYVLQLVQTRAVDSTIALIPTGFEDVFGRLKLPSTPSGLREVFHIEGKYTYDEAPSVCAVYNAELATQEQVMEAYAKGAEWCGYGWTLGGMALYPTQDATWKKLQQEIDSNKRTRCGRTGINGGYFDTGTKFGVNCFGSKPSCNNRKYPIPLDSDVNNQLLRKLKEDSGRIKVAPFNRNGWSMWGLLG